MADSDTPALAGPPIHKPCGEEMTPSIFGNQQWPPSYRSQLIWLCVRCSRWEPNGWDPTEGRTDG